MGLIKIWNSLFKTCGINPGAIPPIYVHQLNPIDVGEIKTIIGLNQVCYDIDISY